MRDMFWLTTAKHIANDDVRSLFWVVQERIRSVYNGLSFSRKIWTRQLPLTWLLIGGKYGDGNRKGWVFADLSAGQSSGSWNI